MQTKKDFSYGVIPIRHVESEWEVFLIEQYSHIGNNSYWVFPKGHPEENETPLETAKRELTEETGFVVDRIFLDKTFKLKYTFLYGDNKIDKTVEFFVVTVHDFVPVLDSYEVKNAFWCPLLEAVEKLDYADTKRMYLEAIDFIKEIKL